MVLRHHHEAESLHAVQKMDWEWKLRELGEPGTQDPEQKLTIDEASVPMVAVSDDFNRPREF